MTIMTIIITLPIAKQLNDNYDNYDNNNNSSDNQTTKQQINKTTKQLNNQTTKQPNNKITKQLNNKIAKKVSSICKNEIILLILPPNLYANYNLIVLFF